MENSRETILNSIKSGKPKLEFLPDIPTWSVGGDKIDCFKSHLKSFDGDFQDFNSKEAVIDYLNKVIDKSRVIFSSADDFEGNIKEEDFKTPHDANAVYYCVSDGVLGVAETGSVWLTNNSLKLSATALFSTNLYILLKKENIVGNMYDA